MKKRVYKIKDKILVQGDENLLTEDEVLVKEENGSVVLKERVNGEVINVVVGNKPIEDVYEKNSQIIDASNAFGGISINLGIDFLDREKPYCIKTEFDGHALYVFFEKIYYPGEMFMEASGYLETEVTIGENTVTVQQPMIADFIYSMDDFSVNIYSTFFR